MEHNITELVTHFVLQIAVILLVAKLAGEFTERVLKQPGVIGELLAGIVIGPYALGARIPVPHLGPLFPLPHGGTGGIPVSNELYAFAQLAAVVLLFMAGLETHLGSFLRYGFPASVVGAAGVVFPFVLGAWATSAWGLADGFLSPTALFVGAAMVATSVGITARVLSELRKLDTPEGVTILGAAVVDDILGIMVLAMVVGVADSGALQVGSLAVVGAKALFFLGLAAVGVLASKHISRLISWFRSPGSEVALALAICCFFAAFAEVLGLAMIIGAYFAGLALSSTDLAERLRDRLHGLYHSIVPVFFVVMGMLVDVEAMKATLAFGLVLSVLAVISKVIGCGLPALGVGFNKRGGLRIGLGMLPRGEVALIIAGVGIARGVIGQEIYGVTVLMTLVTTILAPIALVPAFKHGGSGLKERS